MFGTKSKSWEYENEIRLIYSTSKRKGYNPFALKSIYFGLNMDEMHQIQIIEGLTNRDIRLSRSRLFDIRHIVSYIRNNEDAKRKDKC